MSRFTTLGLTILLAFAPAALAVDGTVLINQSTSVNGLPSCGSSGFPIFICQSGSYRLSGDLILPNANTTAVVIAASNVTLDLNGFSISGPVTCTPGTSPLQCSASGSGEGITSGGHQLRNITIENGTVQGMGFGGIDMVSVRGLVVRDMHVESIGPGTSPNCVPPINPSNCGVGILVQLSEAIVARCTVETSAGDGILGGMVTFSAVANNGGNGIHDAAGVADSEVSANGLAGISNSSNVKDNTISGNIGFGLIGVAGYSGNILVNNLGGTVSASTSLGGNLCNGAGC